MKRVLVGMSGGVDSTVTAALLQKEGYEVIGGTMKEFNFSPDKESTGLAVEDKARKIAEKLQIPLYTFDLEKEFEKIILDNFVSEYSQGRTPNPCIICNRKIKFKILLNKAKELGIDFLATGHYARIIHDKSGRHLLAKPEDRDKDQTYMLYRLNQYQLEHTLFPLGNLTKDEVRRNAAKLGFEYEEGDDSQDICFLPDNDYIGFLESYAPESFRQGPILDEEGNELGQHNGLHNYTIGQRKGLGIAKGYPIYVIRLDLEKNAVIVGKNEKVFGKSLIAHDLNWISVENLSVPIEVEAKIRYNSPASKAMIYPVEGGGVKVDFVEKQRAITPGQSVVFYDGEVVIGGGIIYK